MKKSKKIARAIGIALGSIVYYATPGWALTWNFTYTSDGNQYNFPTGYGSQSGSFVALGSEVDGTYPISDFQFTHGTLTSYSFDTTGTSTFMNTVSANNMVTITGGTVSAIDLFVNDSNIPGEGSFEISSAFDQVTLYNTTNGTFGNDIDGSNFITDITFTPASSGVGASWEFSPGPALAIITVGWGINKLVKMARSRHKDKQK